jgi:hypothetical protein
MLTVIVLGLTKNKRKCGHLDSDVDCYCLGIDEKTSASVDTWTVMLTVVV